MAIAGTENMTPEELRMELQAGGKFVVFSYCISIVILTFKRSSKVHFVKANESALEKGLPYTLLTLVAGWWGFPFGPIFSIWALAINLRGGQDVTPQITGLSRQLG